MPCRKLQRQVLAAEVDIEQRSLNAAMAGKRGNLMDIPSGAGQVGQAKVP